MSLLLLLLPLLYAAPVAAEWTICVIPAKGFVSCDPKASPQTYSGHDVDLIRWLMNRVGVTETFTPVINATAANSSSQQFRLVCTGLGYAALIKQLQTPGTINDCAAGMAAVSVTAARLAGGIRYSFPYMKTGLAIVIYKVAAAVDHFAFLRPFAMETWVAFVCTIFMVPIVAWVVERLSEDGAIPFGWASLSSLRQATYETMLAVYNLQVYQVKSIPAQIIIYTFGFMVLITISTYTSQLSAQFTLNNLQTSISSIRDLTGQPVATHSAYLPRLIADYSRTFIDIEWTGQPAFDQAVNALQNGTLSAYLMSKVLLDPYVTDANQAGDCSLSYASQIPEEPFDVAIAWHTNMSQAIITLLDSAMVAAQETGELAMLGSKYLTPGVNNCGRLSGSSAVRFTQLSGLWVILGGAMGFAVLFVLVQTAIRVVRHYKETHHAEGKGEGFAGDLGVCTSAASKSRVSRLLSTISTLVVHEDKLDTVPFAMASSRRGSARCSESDITAFRQAPGPDRQRLRVNLRPSGEMVMGVGKSASRSCSIRQSSGGAVLQVPPTEAALGRRVRTGNGGWHSASSMQEGSCESASPDNDGLTTYVQEFGSKVFQGTVKEAGQMQLGYDAEAEAEAELIDQQSSGAMPLPHRAGTELLAAVEVEQETRLGNALVTSGTMVMQQRSRPGAGAVSESVEWWPCSPVPALAVALGPGAVQLDASEGNRLITVVESNSASMREMQLEIRSLAQQVAAVMTQLSNAYPSSSAGAIKAVSALHSGGGGAACLANVTDGDIAALAAALDQVHSQ